MIRVGSDSATSHPGVRRVNWAGKAAWRPPSRRSLQSRCRVVARSLQARAKTASRCRGGWVFAINAIASRETKDSLVNPSDRVVYPPMPPPATDLLEPFRKYLTVLAERPPRPASCAASSTRPTWSSRRCSGPTRPCPTLRAVDPAAVAAWLREILASELADAVKHYDRDRRDVGRERSLEADLDRSASGLAALAGRRPVLAQPAGRPERGRCCGWPTPWPTCPSRCARWSCSSTARAGRSRRSPTGSADASRRWRRCCAAGWNGSADRLDAEE